MVGSAVDGLREVARQRPDAILLDLRLPFMNGLQFLRELRAQEPDTRPPVTIVTGDYLIDEQTIEEAQKLGATVQFKPLWLDDLVAITRNMLIAGGIPDADRHPSGITTSPADAASMRID